jgi:hypothetical protein
VQSSGRSNCALFALALWWRRRRAGRPGTVRWRMSWRTPLSVHVMYARPRRPMFLGQWQVVSYAPPEDHVARLLPPPVFRGRVYWGDHHPGKIEAPWYLRWWVDGQRKRWQELPTHPTRRNR